MLVNLDISNRNFLKLLEKCTILEKKKKFCDYFRFLCYFLIHYKRNWEMNSKSMKIHKNAIKYVKKLDKSQKSGNQNKTIDLNLMVFFFWKRAEKNSPLNSNLIRYSSSILTFAGCLCSKKEILKKKNELKLLRDCI